jgi:DNA-binding IscR family transcriptional regulator
MHRFQLIGDRSYKLNVKTTVSIRSKHRRPFRRWKARVDFFSKAIMTFPEARDIERYTALPLRLRILVFLAERWREPSLGIAQVSELPGASSDEIQAAVRSIIKLDYVKLLWGGQGRLQLARSPHSISLMRVIFDIDEPTGLNWCGEVSDAASSLDLILRRAQQS